MEARRFGVRACNIDYTAFGTGFAANLIEILAAMVLKPPIMPAGVGPVQTTDSPDKIMMGRSAIYVNRTVYLALDLAGPEQDQPPAQDGGMGRPRHPVLSRRNPSASWTPSSPPNPASSDASPHKDPSPMLDASQIFDGTITAESAPANKNSVGVNVTSTAQSTNVLDLLTGRDVGAGNPLGIHVDITTAFTTTNSATLQLQFEVSAATNSGFVGLALSPSSPPPNSSRRPRSSASPCR